MPALDRESMCPARRLILSRLAISSALLVSLAACSDIPRPVEPNTLPSVSAKIVPNEDPGAPQDPNLNQADTYAVAIVEVQQRDVTYADSLVVNPADMTVGHVFDSSTPVMKYRYEVGYDRGGQQLAAQRATPGDTADGGQPDEGVNLSLIGSGTIAMNTYGASVALGTSDEVNVAATFRSALGNINAVPPLINGFVQAVSQSYLTSASPLASAAAASASATSANFAPTAPPGVRVTEIQPGVVESEHEVRIANGSRTKRSQFVLVDSTWQLRKLNLIDRVVVRGLSEYHEASLSVRQLRVRRNPAHDALRTVSHALAAETDVLTFDAANIPKPYLVVPPDSGPTLPPPPPPPASCVYSAVRSAATGPRVNFQHGILTDACTWGAAYGPDLFQRGTNLRAVRISETPADEIFAVQAPILNTQLQATQAGAWVIVGHSNGGIVARKAHALYGSENVGGIITLDTPHAGASITQYNRQFAATAADAVFGTAVLNSAAWAVDKLGASGVFGSISNAVLRKYGPGLLFVSAGIGPVFISGSQNVFLDMQPGAGSAGGLNQPGAETFNIKRIAIFSESPRSWLSVRVACDFLKKDGDACVRNMRIANRLAWLTAVVGTIAGLSGWSQGFALARGALALSASATAMDLTWKYLVDGLTQGDGTMSSYTQRAFPGGILQFQIPGNPTHQKVTRSLEAKRLAEGQLRSQFGAQIVGQPIP